MVFRKTSTLALLVGLGLMVSSPGQAEACTWLVKGKLVDQNGRAMAGVKVRIDARWASPPGPWNDVNWPDPTTKNNGSFSVKSRKLLGCKKRRDIRLRVHNGKKWREVAKLKKRKRGKGNFGTVKIRRTSALAKSVYIPRVRSLPQRRLKGNEDDGQYEGCGPVAVSMLLAYWQTQRGKKRLLTNYREDKHPKTDIKRLNKVLKTARVYSPEPQDQTATGPLEMIAGMKKLVKGKGLKSKHQADIVPWSKRRDNLKRQLTKKRPVMLLVKNIQKCIGGKKRAGWHYVVAVGYDSKNVQLMTGWKNHKASSNTRASKHKRRARGDDAHGRGLCTWAEIRNSNPGLYWYQ